MTSLHLSHRVDAFDPEAIRLLVAKGKASGMIQGGEPSAPKKITVAQIKEITEARAKSAGIGIAAPAPVSRDGHAAAADASIVSQWMMVDPGLAAHWLQNNFVNRPMAEDTVTAYARDMHNGVWVATHQGIAFNDQDHLIDGQHRLAAIIMCGKTIKMMVTFGLPSAIDGTSMTTMDAVDRGRTRSVADQLKIQHGLKNGSAIAAITASIGSACYHKKTKRLSVGQTLEIYHEFRAAINFVIERRPKEHGLKMTGVLAAFSIAITAEPDKAGKRRRLFEDLVTGDGLFEHTALDHLRSFLLSDDAKLLSRGTDRGVTELTLQAIHLHETTPSIRKLELDSAGLAHFRALQPERIAKVAAIFEIPNP